MVTIDMTALQTTAIIGAIAVPVVSFIKREKWNEQVKFLVSIAVAAVLAIAEVVFAYHTVTLAEFSTHFAVAVATMQTIYRLYFSNAPWDKYLTAIGSKAKQVGDVAVAVDPSTKPVVGQIEAAVAGLETAPVVAATVAAQVEVTPPAVLQAPVS